MHSFIITHADLNIARTHVKSLNTSNQFDTLILTPPEQSISIDQIRQAIDWIGFTPHGQTKTLIIDPADTLTPQAQHALLKTLEEPPPYAKIFLITTATSQLLPTIISRCAVTNLIPENAPPSSPQILDILQTKPLLRLKHTAQYKDKTSSITWLQSLVKETHALILEKKLAHSVSTKTIKQLLIGIKALEGNTSIPLTLDNTLIKLPCLNL